MIYFTSDTHLGHTNIIKYCNRPFNSIEEMDEVLIVNWNSVIGPTDVVWHLGDFSFRNKKKLKEYWYRLNGKKHIIFGNHDEPAELAELAEWSGYVREVRWEGHRFFLSHYAHRVWPRSHHGTFHLYGHSHGELPGIGRSMDVGVDAHNYFPISAEAVVKLLEKEPHGVHHDSNR